MQVQDTPAAAAGNTAPVNLKKYAYLSIGAAGLTILLKSGAYALTGSVGLLSDAAESVVNLVAAAIMLGALTIAARPADERHHYGHGKVEFFSAGLEGLMIFVAASFIFLTAIERLLHPKPLEQVGVGLIVSAAATVVNGLVGALLLREGKRHGSLSLVADGHHLLTDVWTSVGVVAGVALVAITGWERLDPLIAGGVAVNITVVGMRLIMQSVAGLMDRSLPLEENERIADLLRARVTDEVGFHGLQTRAVGAVPAISFHVTVPGAWSVQQAHDLVEDVEQEVRDQVERAMVTTHIEPREDSRAYGDVVGEHPITPPTTP